jgi:hypothetical protein
VARQKHTEYLSWDQMWDLSTQRLLAYRKSLLELPEWRTGLDAPWWHAEYTRALAQSKAILDNREHIQKGA